MRLLNKRPQLKVLFVVVNESIWKYDALYALLQKDSRFDPAVVVAPFTSQGAEAMEREFSQTTRAMQQKGYTLCPSLTTTGSWIDIKKEYNPDLLFFSSPWDNTLPQYQIFHFLDRLTCYVPYGFKSSNLYQAHYNLGMQKFCWKFFVETPLHLKLAERYSERRGRNAVVTGAPGMDQLLHAKEDGPLVWKSQPSRRKRVIWAPHHTIPGIQRALNYATFLEIADDMLALAEEYADRLQFAFKPHPHLRGKLTRLASWGPERTEAYYRRWSELSNGQLEEGGYVELFRQSDGMIHDSGAFLVEYLYTQKPVLYLLSSDEVKKEFSSVGQEALKRLYQGRTLSDIRNFINNQLLAEDDPLGKERHRFFEEVIRPPHHRTASQNIYHHLLDELGWQAPAISS